MSDIITSTHRGHGGNRHRFLRSNFDQGFYQDFNEDFNSNKKCNQPIKNLIKTLSLLGAGGTHGLVLVRKTPQNLKINGSEAQHV